MMVQHGQMLMLEVDSLLHIIVVVSMSIIPEVIRLPMSMVILQEIREVSIE